VYRPRAISSAFRFDSVELPPECEALWMATAKPDKHRLLRGFAPASRRAQGAIPTIAWREMAGASNVYRHDYEDVALSYV
jgi:hypothetical protein